MPFASLRERSTGKRAVRFGVPVGFVLIVAGCLAAHERHPRLSLVLFGLCIVALVPCVSIFWRRPLNRYAVHTTLAVDTQGKTRTEDKSDIPLPNEQLASLFRWMPVGIVYFGQGRRVLYCNEAFSRIYGFEKGELMGQVPPLPEARQEEWREIERNLRRGKHFRNLETVRLRKDGSPFRAYISGLPLFDNDRELAGFIGVIVESESFPLAGGIPYEHILSLAESSRDFLLLLDTKFHVVYANPGFAVAAGVDEAALNDSDILGYFAPEDRARIEAELGAALLPGTNLSVIEGRLNLGGNEVSIPVSLEFYPVNGADGDAPSAIACIVHDLQRETELSEQLHQSATEGRTLFEAAPIGIVKVNTKGYPIACNPKFQEMLGYSGEELAGIPFASLVHPLDLPRGRALFLDLISGKIEHYQIPKRLVRKDGVAIQTTMTVSLVRDVAGLPSHTISMIAEAPSVVVDDADVRPAVDA